MTLGPIHDFNLRVEDLDQFSYRFLHNQAIGSIPEVDICFSSSITGFRSSIPTSESINKIHWPFFFVLDSNFSLF